MDVSCPKCGQHLQAPDEADGKKVKCAKCGLAFAADATAQSPVEYETTIVPAKIRPWRRVATVILGVLCVLLIIIGTKRRLGHATTPSRAQLCAAISMRCRFMSSNFRRRGNLQRNAGRSSGARRKSENWPRCAMSSADFKTSLQGQIAEIIYAPCSVVRMSDRLRLSAICAVHYDVDELFKDRNNFGIGLMDAIPESSSLKLPLSAPSLPIVRVVASTLVCDVSHFSLPLILVSLSFDFAMTLFSSSSSLTCSFCALSRSSLPPFPDTVSPIAGRYLSPNRC